MLTTNVVILSRPLKVSEASMITESESVKSLMIDLLAANPDMTGGEAREYARRIIEADGMYVCPGFVDMHDQVKSAFGGHLVSERDHFTELPRGVHVQKRKGGKGREKGLAGKVQHDCRVLADGIEHHRVAEFGDHFADDMDAFGFKLLQVS